MTKKHTLRAGDPGRLYRRRSQALSRAPAARMSFPHRRSLRTMEHCLQAACCARLQSSAQPQPPLAPAAQAQEAFHSIQPPLPFCSVHEPSLVLLLMKAKVSAPHLWHHPPVPDLSPSLSLHGWRSWSLAVVHLQSLPSSIVSGLHCR